MSLSARSSIGLMHRQLAHGSAGLAGAHRGGIFSLIAGLIAASASAQLQRRSVMASARRSAGARHRRLAAALGISRRQRLSSRAQRSAWHRSWHLSAAARHRRRHRRRSSLGGSSALNGAQLAGLSAQRRSLGIVSIAAASARRSLEMASTRRSAKSIGGGASRRFAARLALGSLSAAAPRHRVNIARRHGGIIAGAHRGGGSASAYRARRRRLGARLVAYHLVAKTLGSSAASSASLGSASRQRSAAALA